MPPGEQVNQVALQPVGVLVFVHEDELEPALVMVAEVRVVLEQLEPEREEVVKIHPVGGPFAGGVALLQAGDFDGELREMAELPGHQFVGGFVRVGREGENLIQHVRLGKVLVLLVNFRVGHAGLDQVLRVVAVEDGEVAPEAEDVGVQPQNPRADGVKRAAPERAQVVAEQVGHAAHHRAVRTPAGQAGARRAAGRLDGARARGADDAGAR